MRRSLRIFLLGVAVAAISLNYGCSHVTSPGDGKVNPPVTQVEKQVESANNSFAANLFTQVAVQEKGKNFFISPLSVSMALAMTLNGADGQTYTDMQKTLGLDGLSNSDINQSYQYLMTMFANLDPGVTFTIANSIWYRNTFPVLSSFIEVDSTYFDSDVKPLNFNDPSAAGVINSWVSNKTHGKIPDIITPPIDPSVIMYLINALYFNGNWKYIFDSTKTKPYPFYLSDGSTESDSMMVMRDSLNYYFDANFQVVELPYGDGDYSMLVLLPVNSTSTNVFASLNQTEINSIIRGLSPQDVQLTLPKFNVQYGTSLKDVLSQMGMGSAFAGNADFTRISPAGGLAISDVLHKTYIDVNEKGTVAAAVTVVIIYDTVVEPIHSGPILFNVNRPFLFLMKENHNNTIMFMGAINQPSVHISE
ncbi:MAG TPA: serpin family protein [Candidatus Kryptonia bacterium]